ncbi:MAG: PA2169 family four-helix-bundle protein [Pseudomonadota bacterium]
MAKDKDFNLDPISKEPGAHPVGTGVGAAAGGAAAGAVAGAFGGPVGAVIGAVAGAVVGGLGGKAAAESINPTAEAAYWESNYEREPYYESGRSYEDYAPAYRLGLYGRTEYPGSFDDAERHLENHWESKKERSTLTWPQASAASRAAWLRADAQLGTGALEEVDKDDVIDTLNDLLESCRDGEYGFRECAEHSKAQDIKVLLTRHSAECRAAGYELLTLIQQLGGKADDGGTASGAMHRGWVSVRAALGTSDDQAMLDEAERGEDVAVSRYRKALKQNLPAHIRTVVQRQADGTQRNHDQVKALRDALKAGKR